MKALHHYLVLACLATLVGAVTSVAEPPPTTAPDIESRTAKDLPLNLRGATGNLAEWLKPFDRTPEAFDYTVQPLREEETLRFYRLTFPSAVKTRWPENNSVPCELYLPKTITGKIPAAIVLDILDGSGIVPRGLARGLAEQGVAALYMPMALYGPRRPKDKSHLKALVADPSLVVDNMRQTVLDIRRAKALLAARPEIDPQRLALTGVSLGGIMTTLAAGVDGEFARVVPILAGGDLTAITFHARETRQIRQAIEGKGMTQADTARLLAPVEPLNFASRIAPQTCLMINAARDEVIPKESTEALNRIIGSQILWTPMGHYSTAIFLPNIRQKSIDFILGKKVTDLSP